MPADLKMGNCPECAQPDCQDVIERRGWCWACERNRRIAEEAAKFRDGVSGSIGRHLFEGGIARAELWANWEDVPPSIAKAIPPAWLDGEWVGFGLGGNTGIGKSMALVAGLKRILGRFAEEEIVPSITEDGPKKAFPGFRWSSWPSEVHWLRSHAIDGADERAESLAEVTVLVLDDLGRERMKGDFTQDYAFSHLDFIITERYRNGRPIVWTTNLKLADLAQLYGAPTLRRLIEPNPLAWVDGLKAWNLTRRTA